MTTDPLPDNVQLRLDEHLDEVDVVLRRYRQTRTQRSAITDELHDQVRDMLAARVGGVSPTVTELDAVLSEVDPPEAYARRSIDLEPDPESYAFDAPPPARTNRAAILGLVWFFWFFFALAVWVALYQIRLHVQVTDSMSRSVPAVETGVGLVLFILVVVPGLLAPIGTTILGWLALGQIQRSRGREVGVGLAVFDAVVFVAPLVAAILLVPVYWLAAAQSGPGDGRLSVLSMLALPVLVSLPVGWWCFRRLTRRFDGGGLGAA